VAQPSPETPQPPAVPSPVPTISTHVLDVERGRPAVGVHVSLYKLGEDDRPIRLTQALTDGDGRVRDLLERPMSPGVYRLEFDLLGPRGARTGAAPGMASGAASGAAPGAAARDESFFRRVAIDVLVDDVSRSYHVPLLLAPYAMTTYRGS